MADACRLEGTGFVEGIAMGEYWSSTLDEFSFATPDRRLERTEITWESCDAKKAIAYGNIFGLAFGFSDYSEHAGFPVSFDDKVDDDIFVIEVSLRLLFGIRVGIIQHYGHNVECRWESTNTIPPRYYHKYHTSNSKQNLLMTLIECFRALPSYLHICVEEGSCDALFKYILYLKNLSYLQIKSERFGPTVFELAVNIIQEAANLEILIVNFYPPDVDESPPPSVQSLDPIISAMTPFASSMRLLVAYSRYMYGEIDGDLEKEFFSISYEILKRFMDASSGTAVDHQQVVRLEGTEILCNSIQDLRELINFSKKVPVVEMYRCKFSIFDGKL